MIQVPDSATVDTVSYGISNVVSNDGNMIAISGILVVFFGLVLIAGTIFLFNFIFKTKGTDQAEKAAEHEVVTYPEKVPGIPEDDLIAITTAIELYRRLHFDPIKSKVTFARGESNTNWKSGHKFGQRHALR